MLALVACNGDRPNAIRIVGVERHGDISIPALSQLRALDPVALAIRIQRQGVPEIVGASRIEFITFRCGRELDRFYPAELYGDGVPLGRDWRRDVLDPNSPMPESVTLIAFTERRVIDAEGHQCARFIERRRIFLELETSYILSNTVRIPPAPPPTH